MKSDSFLSKKKEICKAQNNWGAEISKSLLYYLMVAGLRLRHCFYVDALAVCKIMSIFANYKRKRYAKRKQGNF